MVAASGEFRRVFASFDQDGDGKISAAELRLCMKAAAGENVPAEDVRALMASADADGDGLLDEEEFVRLAGEVVVEAEDHEHDDEDRRGRWLREAFGMYEMDGSGCITALSLKLMLGKLGAHRDIGERQAMICRFDLDGDGVLSFDEFKTMLMG
ncbi:putative calcium-binding protein CML23 [Panicum miliaceum]|uniref:Calcium-binding protein CML23 n=1 Tax=Panicum miliaceum TaxID=4540 RepID=A0A3L6SSH7_PANMI|nr:putative calcium-binding protein CML23 [Panicum miliaceum]